MQSTPAAYRQWQIIWKVSVCARVAVPVCVQGGSDALFLFAWCFDHLLSRLCNKKRETSNLLLNGCKSNVSLCRDDWIRTSDHTPPRLPGYKAEKYDYQQLMGVSLLVV